MWRRLIRTCVRRRRLSLCFHFAFKWNSKFETLQNQMLFKFMIIKMVFLQQAQKSLDNYIEGNKPDLALEAEAQTEPGRTCRENTMPAGTGVWWGGRNTACAGLGDSGVWCRGSLRNQAWSSSAISQAQRPCLPGSWPLFPWESMWSALLLLAWKQQLGVAFASCPREILDLHPDWDCQGIPKAGCRLYEVHDFRKLQQCKELSFPPNNTVFGGWGKN